MLRFLMVYLCSLSSFPYWSSAFLWANFCLVAHVAHCMCIGGSGDSDDPLRPRRRMKQTMYVERSSEDSADNDHTPSEEADDHDFGDEIEEENEEVVFVQEDPPERVA